MSINYVTIKKFCELSGYSEDAVNSKIKRGDWLRDREYIKAPDGRNLINVDRYHEWVETSIQASARPVQQQSKSVSITKGKNVVNVSSCSPLPLT